MVPVTLMTSGASRDGHLSQRLVHRPKRACGTCLEESVGSDEKLTTLGNNQSCNSYTDIQYIFRFFFFISIFCAHVQVMIT